MPQTGAKQNKLTLIGLAFASLAGLIGLAGTRNRKN
ncbi:MULTISPECIES: LPXTG cell wall anchor domain-containing protein [Lactobacillus]